MSIMRFVRKRYTTRTHRRTEADVVQFKEAYADKDEAYIVQRPEAIPTQRALVFWSDSYYTGEELQRVVPGIVPSYNKFDGVETLAALVELYPNAWFLPAREYGVCIYVIGGSDYTSQPRKTRHGLKSMSVVFGKKDGSLNAKPGYFGYGGTLKCSEKISQKEYRRKTQAWRMTHTPYRA